ncbi:hypothetical protein [Thioclava sp. GXIMD4215]|uniref:hypothetical protein n=1 Tax=Thioclava sp. GXIMD4215 TaxID=3131928 RepID=UPI003244AD37
MVLLLVGAVLGLGLAPAGGESIRSPFGVSATRQLPSAQLRHTRRAMIEDRPVTINRLRALADAGDGLAAFNFAKILEAEHRSDLRADIAHYYAIAVHTGRVFAVNRLIETTDRGLAEGAFEGAATRLRQIGQALEFAAVHGNANAASRVAEAWRTGDLFGTQDAEKATEYGQLAIANGNLNLASQMIVEKAKAKDSDGLQQVLELVGQNANIGMLALGQNVVRLETDRN